MTLASKIREQWNASARSTQRIILSDVMPNVCVELDVVRMDDLALQLSMLRITSGVIYPISLADRSVKLSESITGLTETLKLLELDNDLGIALLRSDTPEAQADKRNYFEMKLHKNGMAELLRYKGSIQNAERKVIPFSITFDALQKLIQAVGQKQG